MAHNNTKQNEKKIKEAQDAVGSLAKIAGKGIEEIWKIFVRKNIVHGLSVLFVAICLIAGAIGMGLGWQISVPMAIILIVAIVLIFVAINLLGNPAYYAMEDSIQTIKNAMGRKKNEKDY